MVIIYWVHFLVHILNKKHDFKTNHIQIKGVIFLLDQILKNDLVWYRTEQPGDGSYNNIVQIEKKRYNII